MIHVGKYFIKAVPNILTLGNLALGFYSLKLIYHGNYSLAVTLIIVCMFLDCLDGKVARKFNAVSSLGKELDSLSDMVSFGAVPAILTWTIFPFESSLMGLALILFVVCGAYRLARFNVEDVNNSYFIGFPITTAGGLLALISFYMEAFSPVIFTALIVILSFSMVSNIPFYSAKNLNRSKTLMISFFGIVFIVSLILPSILVVLIALYFLSGLLKHMKVKLLQIIICTKHFL